MDSEETRKDEAMPMSFMQKYYKKTTQDLRDVKRMHVALLEGPRWLVDYNYRTAYMCMQEMGAHGSTMCACYGCDMRLLESVKGFYW